MRPLILVSLCLAVLVASIAYACSAGDFFEEGRELLRMPWGQVTLVDLYVGFALFAGWIFTRERSRLAALVWVLALLFLGNVIACVYALHALWSSTGERARFWLGSREST